MLLGNAGLETKVETGVRPFRTQFPVPLIPNVPKAEGAKKWRPRPAYATGFEV